MDKYRQAVHSSARAHAYDDYLAALFSPVEKREDVLSLCAYYGEIARIPLVVKDHILAQIRFQWWRDILEKGLPTGHPVADRLLLVKEKNEIPLELLLSLLDLRSLELNPHLFSDQRTVQEYARTIEVPHFRVRALLLGCPVDPSLEAILAEVAGILGALRLCLRLPYLVTRGQAERSLMSSDRVSQQKTQHAFETPYVQEIIAILVAQIKKDTSCICGKVRDLERSQRCLFLPLALLRPYLKVLERKESSLFSVPRTTLPLTRFLSLFIAATFRRF